MSNDDIPRMVTCAMVKTSYLLCFDSHCVGWMTIPYISIYIYTYIHIYIYIIWIIWLIACVTMFFYVRNMRLWQLWHMWFVNCKNRRWRRGVSLLFQLPLHGLQGLVEIAPKTTVVPQWNVFWFMNVYDDIWSLYQLISFIIINSHITFGWPTIVAILSFYHK